VLSRTARAHALVIMFVAVLLFAGIPSGNAEAQDGASDTLLCFQSVYWELGQEDLGESKLHVTWSARLLSDEDTVGAIMAFTDFEDVYVMYSPKDSLFDWETRDRSDVTYHIANSFSPQVPEVDATDQTHFLRVVAFIGDDTLTSKAYVQAGPPMEKKPFPSPGLAFFWFLDYTGIWSEPYEVFKSTQPLGQRAFDALVLIFMFGAFLLLPRIWLLFRSSRLCIINRTVAANDGKYNELDIVVGQELSPLPATMKDKFMKLVEERLTRRAFYGNLFGSIVRLAPSFLEFGVRRKRDISHIPSVKVIKTAVTAINSGEETDLERALELRISAEHEDLRKRSLLDVLWALGATAPLLGLFGTVTGISHAFKQLANPEEGAVVTGAIEIMDKLGQGIFEALWTTIMGLICGILFMSNFYYYSYKLDRIYSIWASFGAEVMDLVREIGGKATAESTATNKGGQE